MPVYKFKCPEPGCYKTSEVVKPLKGEEELLVPFCLTHKRPMRRVYTAPAIHFRGSGWAGGGRS